MTDKITLYSIWVMFFLLQFQTANYGQNDDIRLSDAEISELKSVVVYDKTKKVIKPKKSNKNENEEERDYSPSNVRSDSSGGVRMLLYGLILALVVALVVLLFSNIKLDEKKIEVKEFSLDEIEDIETIDADQGLTMALQAGNYREGVRMLFIQLLQHLIEEDSLVWRLEKTNRDYLREMSNHTQFATFSKLVMAYEGAWYGDIEVSESYFLYLQKQFSSFYNQSVSE